MTRKFHYHCDQNHRVESPKPLTSCPAVVKGKPCPGKIKRVGPGSRTKAKTDA